jgi:hypothetical protein
MAVTPDVIAVALGRPLPATDSVSWQQWSMWIDDALFLIENRPKELGGPLNLADLNPTSLDYVVREAVKAAVREHRPDDATQVDIAIDDGRVSKRYVSGTSRVKILDEWWDLLSPASATSGAFSVRPYGAPDVVVW